MYARPAATTHKPQDAVDYSTLPFIAADSYHTHHCELPFLLSVCEKCVRF